MQTGKTNKTKNTSEEHKQQMQMNPQGLNTQEDNEGETIQAITKAGERQRQECKACHMRKVHLQN